MGVRPFQEYFKCDRLSWTKTLAPGENDFPHADLDFLACAPTEARTRWRS